MTEFTAQWANAFIGAYGANLLFASLLGAITGMRSWRDGLLIASSIWLFQLILFIGLQGLSNQH